MRLTVPPQQPDPEAARGERHRPAAGGGGPGDRGLGGRRRRGGRPRQGVQADRRRLKELQQKQERKRVGVEEA